MDEAKKSFKVKVAYDAHAVGDTVELTDAEAKDLLAAGKIEAAA